MRLTKADPNLKHVQVTHFLTRLSDQVRKDVNLVKATRPENVDTVSGIVQTLVTLYPPTKISAKPVQRSWVTTQTRCPKLTNAAPVPTRHSSALVTNQSSSQNGFTTAYQEPEAESKDPTVEDFYELFSKRPSNHLSQSLSEQTSIDYNSAFLVLIFFKSVQLSAYIDSKASHSSVPQTLLQQIPHRKVIPPVPNSKTSLGAKDAIHPDWVALTYRSHGTIRILPII
ncbi:hypothetical protein BASA60_001627 [Batrachochytrium salamandrivorans]|nr:hypothetical protein BASA60_001627 [Batrachochytrium salamandrivorans]